MILFVFLCNILQFSQLHVQQIFQKLCFIVDPHYYPRVRLANEMKDLPPFITIAVSGKNEKSVSCSICKVQLTKANKNIINSHLRARRHIQNAAKYSSVDPRRLNTQNSTASTPENSKDMADSNKSCKGFTSGDPQLSKKSTDSSTIRTDRANQNNSPNVSNASPSFGGGKRSSFGKSRNSRNSSGRNELSNFSNRGYHQGFNYRNQRYRGTPQFHFNNWNSTSRGRHIENGRHYGNPDFYSGDVGYAQNHSNAFHFGRNGEQESWNSPRPHSGNKKNNQHSPTSRRTIYNDFNGHPNKCDDTHNRTEIRKDKTVPTEHTTAVGESVEASSSANEGSGNVYAPERSSISGRSVTGCATMNISPKVDLVNKKSQEAVTGKNLSRLINPSNPKADAEVQRLVLEHAKSKKRVNLMRRKSQASRKSTESNADTPDNVDKVQHEAAADAENVPGHIFSEPERNQAVSSSDKQANNTSTSSRSSKSGDSSAKRKSDVSDNSLFKNVEQKRRCSSPVGIGKKHTCSTSECLEGCRYSTETNGALSRSTTSDSGLLESEILQAEVFPPLKDPLFRTEWEEPARQRLNDVLQRLKGTPDLDEVDPSSVESLIALFASGEARVKDEVVDDPLVDAIRAINAQDLARFCSSSPAEPAPQSPTTGGATVAGSEVTAGNISLAATLCETLGRLQQIATREERLKRELREADENIAAHQALLEQWRAKKMKFQSEEENIRMQRNGLIKEMHDNLKRISTEQLDQNLIPPKDSNQAPSWKAPKEENSKVSDDEIVVLPRDPPNIPVIDLDSSSCDSLELQSTSPKSSDSVDWSLKSMAIHGTAIKCIQVFDHFMYTSANEFTVNRFSLKDKESVEQFEHVKKGVGQICIEKIGGQTVVFTLCTLSKLISVFDAQNGEILKRWSFEDMVTSICKGWGNVYVSLINGKIYSCSVQEQTEVVRSEEGVRLLASGHQGALRVLACLHTGGSVAVRDGQGLLLRCLHSKCLRPPQHMCLHHDHVYLLDGTHVLVLSMSNENYFQQIKVVSSTAMCVDEGNIYTTTSTGRIRCVSKEQTGKVVSFYGAGKKNLTAIHVQNGHIFTGNKNGEVEVFKINSNIFLKCLWARCGEAFGRPEDLEHHVVGSGEHRVPEPPTRCKWAGCNVPIQQDWGDKKIKEHLMSHVRSLLSPTEIMLYNIKSDKSL